MTEQDEFNHRSPGSGSRPVPDPTVLTTAALREAITALQTLVDQRINATEALFDTKILLGREGGMALKELIEAKLADMRDLLQERYATQTKALDAAFLAQQAAVATSFDASEKAMAAALLAAKEAVDKANMANEKRFESVNEFRAQLNDMIRILLPRSEADAKFAALDARVADNKDGIASLIAQLAGNTGADTGTRESRNDSRANIAIGISVGMGLLTMLTMIIINAMHIAGH